MSGGVGISVPKAVLVKLCACDPAYELLYLSLCQNSPALTLSSKAAAVLQSLTVLHLTGRCIVQGRSCSPTAGTSDRSSLRALYDTDALLRKVFSSGTSVVPKAESA